MTARAITLSLLAALALAGAAPAELRIEGETKAAPHRLVRLRAVGAPEKAAVVWDVSDEDALDVEERGAALVLTGPPGSYRVRATALSLTADGRTVAERARVTVTIGEGPPPAPPAPPSPPAPPEDPLAKALRPAWEADAGPDRERHAKALAALYRQAPAAMDRVKTAGELRAALKDAAAILLPDSALPNLRKAAAAELKAVLPGKAADELTDRNRNEGRSLFGRLAAVLEGLR